MNKMMSFVLGVSLGAAAGVLISKSHFENLAREEIDAIKEHYGKRTERTQPVQPEKQHMPDKRDVTVLEYVKKIQEAGYMKETPSDVASEVYRPYVIRPEQFGLKEEEGYSTISLSYYADGVLADDADHPMDDREIEDVIGKESLDHFGEYEDDSVHVRNDRMKCDFEILIDPRTFDEVLQSKPYLESDIEEET